MTKTMQKANKTSSMDSSEKQISNWFSSIKKILTWKRVTGVATIISLVLAIYVLIPEKSVDRLKSNIRYNIELIENEFHPLYLLHENDSSIYIKKLAYFQQLAIECCYMLATVNQYQDYTEFDYMDFEEARITVGTDIMRIEKANALSLECINALDSLIEYGKSIDPDYVAYLSLSKRANIIEYKRLKIDVYHKHLTRYTELMNKYLYAKSVNAFNTDDYIGYALKEINKLVNDVDFYKYDDAILDYIVEANKFFLLSKRYFVRSEIKKKNQMP